MCGIAGATSPSGIDPLLLPGMGDAIRHRGPDGEGYMLHAPGGEIRRFHGQRPGPDEAPATVGFAHRRLSIIDLSEASDQPMVSEDGRLALAYNGELYNYVELREELAAAGRPARTEGDTEIVLNAYAEWGPACLEKFVGMWALAILDTRDDTLFLSVDRFGIKPLFHTVAGGTLYFASEIKSLLSVPAVAPEPDEDVARKFMLTGRVDESPETFFAGVERLPPAHYAVVPLDRAEPVRPRRYWEIPEQSFRGSRRKAAREFAERFEESVRVHLRSDVPVGTCLSGGLDSSAIVCVAEELRAAGRVPQYAHHGFGYLPQDSEYSERGFMEEVVRRTGLEMTYVQPSHDQFRDALLEIVRRQDEPFPSTSIAAQWFVFGAAREAGLKVMLDGQGADEVLGGYLGFLPLIEQMKERNSPRMRLARLRGTAPPPQDPEAPIPDSATTAVLSPALRERSKLGDLIGPEYGSLNEVLAAHTTTIGMPSLLRFEDRNSMAHSIEARVPFLDHRLVEFAFSLPGKHKIDDGETKAVLRRALEGTLPESIRTRKDKIGFRAEPSATWELAERNRDSLLADRSGYEERWFDRGGVEALLSSGRSPDTEFMLWRVLNTKLWLRTFWGDDAAPLSA